MMDPMRSVLLWAAVHEFERASRPRLATTERNAGCRPPATWDHLSAMSASGMGPPVRQ
jgi:hypothetical protein